MIPQIIHYCWFGGNPLPEQYVEILESWRKYCPDYEIMEWNESNFDLHACRYVEQAYDEKYWAFVSDYARFKILYEHGGLYFDTDVELIRDISGIVERGSFLPTEYGLYGDMTVSTGLGLGFEAHHPVIQEILQGYEARDFIIDHHPNTQYNVAEYVTDVMRKHGFDGKTAAIQICDGIIVYPPSYFAPIDFYSGECVLTDNTYTIHHYGYTWGSQSQKKRNEKLRRYIKLFGREAGPRIWHFMNLPVFVCDVFAKQGLSGVIRHTQRMIKTKR